jgi:predicted nucleotidyltransferase
MLPHHEESIRNAVAYFERLSEVEALLLGGSIAHGLAQPESDVDVLILVSEEHYAERSRNEELMFFSRELSTYPGGYVDGKYVRTAFLEEVAERGSEPARFAFQDAWVLFSRVDGLDRLLSRVVRYPAEGRAERMRRFYAQTEAWYWYSTEALRLENRHLLAVSLGKLVLFCGRLILAHNELLYPYHKWFLEVLKGAEVRPANLFDLIQEMYSEPTRESITAFYETVRDFRDWPKPATIWSNQFHLDSELNWLNGSTPIDDL